MKRYNTRNHIRVPLELAAVILRGGRPQETVTKDVCEAGAFIRGGGLKKGEKVELRLSLPGSRRPLALRGAVAHVLPSSSVAGPGAGIKFSAGGPARALAAYLSATRKLPHKDRDPLATIEFARRQLAGLGIFPVEGSWYAVSPKLQSVHLRDSVLPIYVNGKGLGREYALASAYGEFMERLQNNRLLGETFGLMPAPADRYPDLETKPLSALRRDVGDVMGALVEFPLPEREEARLEKEGLRCLPFYSVNDGKVAYLPTDLLDETCMSNGMCAGNTPEEAMVQGLAEIAERHCMREIVYGGYGPVPTIPADQIDSPSLRARIQELEELGYSVAVKDCTLGGRFPVIGVVVFSRERQTYRATFGAAPTFDVALERCLTESFQGPREPRHPLTFAQTVGGRAGLGEERRNKFYEFYSSCRNGSGEMPREMFLSVGRPEFRKAFLGSFRSNRNALKHMLDIFRLAGGKIFVRDCSFLGFPAFRVYIPGFSEMGKYNREFLAGIERIRREVRRGGLTLKRSPAAKVRELAETLEMLFSRPDFAFESRNYPRSLVPGVMGLKLSKPNDLDEEMAYSSEKLLTVLFHRAGDPAKAATYLEKHLELHPEEASDYLSCCLAYFKLRAGGSGNSEAASALAAFFGKDLVTEVAADIGDPDGAFRYYRLPDCGDCGRCEVRGKCLYDRWKEVDAKLREAARRNPVSQGDLRNVFRMV